MQTNATDAICASNRPAEDHAGCPQDTDGLLQAWERTLLLVSDAGGALLELNGGRVQDAVFRHLIDDQIKYVAKKAFVGEGAFDPGLAALVLLYLSCGSS